MTSTITTVNRPEFITAVEENIAKYESEYSKTKRGSFAERGAYTRLGTAKNLLWRLKNEEIPSTREVVGYFGKGARFID